MEWKKMSVIAKELGVSKDVVKYHKKSLNEDDWGWDDDQIVISPNGVDFIKSRLQKKSYEANFEKYTRDKLRIIERRLEHLDEFLVKKLVIEKEIDVPVEIPLLDSDPEKELVFTGDFKRFLGDDFTSWYTDQKNDMDKWDDWRWDFVKISEIQLYFDYKNGKCDF